MNRPNIIYIHSHDTGRYVQPYGHAVPTPNIQRLAEEGVLFRQAFCANPTCSPSRACLLTGQAAHSCGMTGLVNRGWTLPRPEELLPRLLQKNGYHTARAGIQHVVKDQDEGGFDRILPQERQGRPDVLAAEFLAAAPPAPFFLDVGFTETHRQNEGFAAQPAGEAPTDPRYVKPPAPLPDNETTRRDMALYIDAARTLDDCMGRVFDAVDRAGLKDNTLIVCTTDHGIAFPRMKCNLTDHGTGVMLIMRGPGGFTGGRALDALVSQVDLYPTLCELAGIDRPIFLQGNSLLPLVQDEASQVRDEVFAELNFHAAYEPQRMARTARWKYIRRYDGRATTSLANCDDGLSKNLLLEAGWRQMPLAAERLYDLVFDPHEANNLAADTAHSEVLQQMRQRLDGWMARTDDPLCSGPTVIPPAAAVVNDPDSLSPGKDPHFPARQFMGLE
jgi:N-sulfoglucosamine sulfohydrolase